MKDVLERLLHKDTGKDTGQRVEFRVVHKLTGSELFTRVLGLSQNAVQILDTILF